MNALAALESLIGFFGICISTDDKSESDATEILLSTEVDEYMEALADELGLEWYDVARITDEQPNILAGKKRGSLFWEQGRNIKIKGDQAEE